MIGNRCGQLYKFKNYSFVAHSETTMLWSQSAGNNIKNNNKKIWNIKKYKEGSEKLFNLAIQKMKAFN